MKKLYLFNYIEYYSEESLNKKVLFICLFHQFSIFSYLFQESFTWCYVIVYCRLTFHVHLGNYQFSNLTNHVTLYRTMIQKDSEWWWPMVTKGKYILANTSRKYTTVVKMDEIHSKYENTRKAQMLSTN